MRHTATTVVAVHHITYTTVVAVRHITLPATTNEYFHTSCSGAPHE
jgi:hypothetical protein